jgi:hypothetical protein
MVPGIRGQRPLTTVQRRVRLVRNIIGANTLLVSRPAAVALGFVDEQPFVVAVGPTTYGGAVYRRA